MTINEKITALRTSMKTHQVEAVIISSSDPHLSEYLAPCWQDRLWMTGFTGSAGTAIVTMDHAMLWTDSRYFLQAEKELSDSAFTLGKFVNQFGYEHIDWLCSVLTAGDKVAADGADYSKNGLDQITKFMDSQGISILPKLDLVSSIWEDRPSLPSGLVEIHELNFAVESRIEKISRIRKSLDENKADYLFVSALDEIAWLLNIRGKDVEYNPVVVSYILISKEEVILFIPMDKLPPALTETFQVEQIKVRPYDEVVATLNTLPSTSHVLVDAANINAVLYRAINGNTIHVDSPIKHAKGCKSAAEIDHIRQTMVTDAVALCKAFKWLDDTLKTGEISEYDFANKIAEFRAESVQYRGESFAAIIGYNANGAIVHYRPLQHDCAMMRSSGILLVDTGAQYLGGTTDITRTIALSSPSDAQKKHFTLVLKGHIALAQVIFPRGTTGVQIDVLARQYLWQQGLNFLHGTGHGIGYHLNVHEGPHGISAGVNDKSKTPLKEGMIISNEPGYYLDGQYGIRIENVVSVATHPSLSGFLKFDTLSLYPLDQTLIDVSLLTGGEKAWFNQYQTRVYDEVSPHLDEQHREWFRWKCKLLG
jgi:Xaa-Pro aminopeptidase